MDDSIEWMDAKGGQSYSDDEDSADGELKSDAEASDQPTDRWNESQDESEDEEENPQNHSNLESMSEVDPVEELKFKLVRNITVLSDTTEHGPRDDYKTKESLLQGLEKGLIAISPNGDVIVFSCDSPEKIVFMAKLKMEPFNQYTTKRLEIPLDYDEHITSLKCLPVMSIQRTAIGMVDWNALAIGLSSGYLKLYNEQSVCLLSLKFFDTPIISIKCQTQKSSANGRSESHFATIVDELLVVSKTSAVTIDGIGLYENLKAAKDDLNSNGPHYEPAYGIENLPIVLSCQRWKYDLSQSSDIMDADFFGTRGSSKFDSLKSSSINFEHSPAKTSARSLATVGKSPSLAYYREPKDSNTHSVTELIGSLIPFWSKPAVTRLQMNEISNATCTTLYDKDRMISSILSSPDKRLAVTTDSFGRVMLIDVTNWIVVRMWKGYRSAQCGWVEVKRDPRERASPYATFLVIYAPKRGILEVWSTQRGPRVAAFNVGKNCRLLYSGYRMLNMRADLLAKSGNMSLLTDQSYPKNCYLLNLRSETIFLIELPYTYSLYKYGDLKSRDYLLISELTSAIQNESEISLISEIICRISLAESLQISIQKLAKSFKPDKIVPILENLINKIMQTYLETGDSMSDGDQSIVELSKRLIRICTIFNQLSQLSPNELTLPDVNQRLVTGYEEHPQEIDEFAEQLGWTTAEVLRYLSLSSLERSYGNSNQNSPWPSLGEPLEWDEFVSCFNLTRRVMRRGDKSQKSQEKVSIELDRLSFKFLNEDRVVKTSVFMFNRLSETYFKSPISSAAKQPTNETLVKLRDCYSFLEPTSKLALLFQFWLSTGLCNHWKMWAFLQDQVGKISDELKMIAMSSDNDKMVIDAWKQIYQLIMESENTYAALIATAAIKSDTVRTMNDDKSKDKELASDESDQPESKNDGQRRSSIDWECLLIDAERMSLLGQQLEDVYLLNLLLKYSPESGYLVDRYTYRVPRISVANVLRSGPTVVSELVAQWAMQSGINLKIFTKPYGDQQADEDQGVIISCPLRSSSASSDKQRLFLMRSSNHSNEEHAMELLHHTKTAFPLSLEPDVVLINCMWEFCARWTSNRGLSAADRQNLLKRAFDCLPLLSSVQLRYKLASLVYKTFFQRSFERLVMLVEANSTIMSSKSSRSRDSLTRKELNMGEECLEVFVQFCCDLSELMLQTYSESNKSGPDEQTDLESRLICLDDWWSAPTTERMLDERGGIQSDSAALNNKFSKAALNTLVGRVITAADTLGVDITVELNRLSNLMNLIFKLKVIKAYPMSLIGEESRKILKIDIQQSGSKENESGGRLRFTGPLSELRQKFARKCVLSIVGKISEETNEFSDDDEYGVAEQPEDNDIGKHRQDDEMRAAESQRPFEQQSILSSTYSVASTTKGKHKSAGHRSQTPDSSNFVLGDLTDMNNMRNENNESMLMFANLLSLAKEWELDRDELYLELVFELYRCNHDKLASQISTRVHDQQTLANGLLKICSQRVLVLFGLSPYVSGPGWRKRSDKWSIFQPNVSSWLRSIQQEEIRREIAGLSFSDSLKLNTDDSRRQQHHHHERSGQMEKSSTLDHHKNAFGLQTFVLHALRKRTKLVLETSTNYLEGQAARLAYDLLQLLESPLTDKFLAEESVIDH